MTMNEIRSELKTEKYDFLRTHKHLGANIFILGLGGSYAYGTNVETSDLDIRGGAYTDSRDLLLEKDFGTVVNNVTDTTIYSFNKLVSMLAECNPNTIELLGLKPAHYLYVDKVGQYLLDNKDMFLSQIAAYKFGGYANQQLRRLENGSIRGKDWSIRENHLLKVIQNVTANFKNKFVTYSDNAMTMYIDKSERYGVEIYVDFDFKHYPLRDFNMILEETGAIASEYDKLGKRNKHAKEHEKLEKHAMHLVRLYNMAFDILERKEIVTYREKEHDLLMSIRNGAFNTSKDTFSDEFYEMVDELEKRFEYAKRNTDLPPKPDYKRIEEFVVTVNTELITRVN